MIWEYNFLQKFYFMKCNF